jgi:hypothetical protein
MMGYLVNSELGGMWKEEELSRDLRMGFCMCVNYNKTFTERQRIVPNIYGSV